MSEMITLALAGNPNCGKTTLFNRMTGDCRHVGNWPGVTVERAEGACRAGDQDFWVTDLPGLYSLDPHTLDEAISRDFLAGGSADVIVNVIDAANLERSLYLTSQLLALGRPLVVVLNMMDLAEALRIRLDPVRLSWRLGCPVIPISALRERKADAVLQAAAAAAEAPPPSVAVPADEMARYAFAREAAREAVDKTRAPVRHFSDWLDRYALSRIYGIPFFLAVMYLVFFITVSGSRPAVEWIDGAASRLFEEWPRALLDSWGAPDWLTVLLADGAGAGLRAVATFLPPIFGIFVCLAFLENSGYMARGAFVMDKFLRRIGLPGRAFLPLLVGFGCNVPAMFATRTLKARRERLITLLINPFMSCSARLPVYTLFAVAFFPETSNLVVFSLYLIGITAGVLTGLLLRKTLLRGEPASYVMELPPYQMPSLRAVFLHSWDNLKGFIVRGGKVIVLAVMGLTMLNTWGRGPDGTGESWLERTGKAVTPLFAPMGVTRENWPAAVGLLTGVVAKESVAGTLEGLYGQMEPAETRGEPETGTVTAEEDASRNVVGSMWRYFGSRAAAFAYLLFVLLYVPCVATLAALRKEAGWGWTLFSVTYQTTFAWVVAVLYFQFASGGGG